MKRRILTAIISLSMLLGTLNICVFPRAFAEYSRAENLCIGLGCIEREKYQADKTITRGEFAKIIADLCGFDTDTAQTEWSNSSYGSDNNSEVIIIDPKGGYFDDVDESHPYYNEISAVYIAGYMKGISERRFAPEYDISVMEAAKVITDMLGYAKIAELKGGYPMGYRTIASEHSLLSGIVKDYNSVATQKEVLTLIFNALNVEMMEFEMTTEKPSLIESNKTFMEGILKTYKVRGRITDNGITAITSDSRINDDEIKVGDITAVLPPEHDEYRGYIGRSVEMYYTYDDDIDEYVVKYILVSENDNSITFDIDDFVSYENGKIAYTLGNRTITKRLEASADLIFNNKFKSEYVTETTTSNVSIFDFESGNVTLCSSNGSSYDLIIINNYEYAKVSSINVRDSIIYNELKYTSSVSNVLNLPGIGYLELTEEKYPDFISIKNESGKKLTVADINFGDVLNILRCDGGIDITVTSNRISDITVKSLASSEWGRSVVSDGTNEYEILNAYTDSSNAVRPAVGKMYTLYLNKFGKVVWIEETIKEGTQVGILAKVYYDENEEENGEPLRALKIYTQENQFRLIRAGERITLDDNRGKFENKVTELNAACGKVILYELSEEGLLLSVKTPVEYGHHNDNAQNKSRGWYKINPTGDDISYYFGTNGNDFGQFFYYTAGVTKTFEAPKNPADFTNGDFYTYGKLIPKDNQEFTAIEAYATSPDAIDAEVIVNRLEGTTGSQTGTVNDRTAFLIESISEGITADDEPVKIFKGYNIQLYGVFEPVVLTIDPDAMVIHNGYDTTPSELRWTKISPNASIEEYGPRTVDEYDVGDIIRYNTNTKGMVEYLCTSYDYSQRKGFLVDHFIRTYVGDAISKDNTGVRITDAIAPENIFRATVTEQRDNIKALKIASKPILVVEINGKRMNVRNGTIDDILTYKDSDAAGKYDRVAVMTYATALVYGTIVYKK